MPNPGLRRRARGSGLGVTGGRQGFSLLELVVVLAIGAVLVAMLTVVAGRSVESSNEAATRRQVQRLFSAIIGNPEAGNFGYLGDMGHLPTALADLATVGSQIAYHFGDPPPSGSTAHTANLGIGWRGPYVTGPFSAADLLTDSWGQSLRYDSTGVTVPAGQVVSLGPDGAYGTSDDIAYPVQLPVQTTGTLIVNVIVSNIPQPSGLTVSVYSPVKGEQGTAVTQTTASAGSGKPFRFSVPHGVSAVVATHTSSNNVTVSRTVSVQVRAGTQVTLPIVMNTTGTVAM